jgi:hypothetical protein
MKRAATTLAFVLFVTTNARAAGEDDACAVTAECDAPLRCVHDRCVSLAPKPDWHSKTFGGRAMFGDGRGYTAEIVGADILALVGTTSFLLAAAGIDRSYRGGWQAAAMVPVVIGPVVHATRARWLPAVISFFGWSSFGLTVLTASLLTSACTECATPWLAAGAVVLAIGGSLLTTLDAWMARDVRTARRRSSWFPVVAPTHSGALAGFGGTF